MKNAGTKEKYEHLLFAVSAVSMFAVNGFCFFLSIFIYPPFSVFFRLGGASAENSVIFFTFPVCVSALAFILSGLRDKRISSYTAILSLLCSGCSLFACFLTRRGTFDDQNHSIYIFSSAFITVFPLLAFSFLRNIFKSARKLKRCSVIFFVFAVPAVVISTVLVVFSFSTVIIRSVAFLYLLPFASLSGSIMFAALPSGAPFFVRIALGIYPFQFPFYVIIRCQSNLAALSSAAFVSIGASVLLAASVIIIILFFHKGEKSMSNSVISGLGFHHIGLKVKDFEKSYDFYVNGLGMKPYITWGEGNSRIQMLDIGNGDILELFAGGSEELDRENVWQHLALCVDDVDAAFNAALKAGAVSHIEPKTVVFNSTPKNATARLAFVRGLDNEQIEFFKLISEE